MAADKVRLSQVVGVYGPGAMLDLPERSVLVEGLDAWEMFGKGTFSIIEEPRLARLLHLRLSDDGRLSAKRPPELRTPPIDPGDPRRTPPGIKATVFPRWFVCETIAGDAPNRRRLVRFQDLNPPKRLEHLGDDGKKRRASPIRFVCGCENGHLQDIEWRRVVHQRPSGDGGSGRSCHEPMWLEDSGTSADPRDTRIVCDCGAWLSLEELFQPRRLGACRGDRPWIGDQDPQPCPAREGLRLLTRSATNTYFPQVARVISLPQTVDELTRRIEEFWSVLQGCQSVDDIQAARRFNPPLRASLEKYSNEDVLARIRSSATSAAATQGDAPEDPRTSEYEILASGQSLIGENKPAAHLHAETLDRAIWDPAGDPLLSGIASLVAVHRLREVACLYGFTRFEPAPLANDDLEDIGLAVAGAPLAQDPEWLPAVEQFGEGFFLRFDADALSTWLSRPDLTSRMAGLHAGANAWIEAARRRGVAVSGNPFHERARPEYVMAHSLAHALMTEVALDCGYPASSLKERVYVLHRVPGEPIRCGILIYTATAGNHGTLGGLVDVTRRFDRVLKSALERQRLCSGDPVCADHEPAAAQEDRSLHGAACHGCLLIAETSCEARNLFLDRALLVDTVGPVGAGFF